MPTYEYACRDCGEHVEVVQSFKDDALTVCPSCDGQLRKVFSAAGLIFKGSGWHVKDYATSSRSPSGGDSKSSSDTSAPGSTSSGGGSRSTKAAASTEKKSA
jgi:putative FmdB family regulatory protein